MNRFNSNDTGSVSVNIVNPAVLPTSNSVLEAAQVVSNQLGSIGADMVSHLNLVPGVTDTHTIGNVLALDEWTTIADGLLEGEKLIYDRAAPLLSVASTDTNDNATGTGARTIGVVYIDSAGDQQTWVGALNGQNEVTMTNMQAVNRMFVFTTGGTYPALYNLGTVRVGLATSAGGTWTAGVPSEIFNLMAPERSFSEGCFQMIPAGFGWLTRGASLNCDATVRSDNCRIRTFAYADLGFGSDVSYQGVSVRLIGNANMEYRGIPMSPAGTVLVSEARSDRNGGIDVTCAESGYLIDLSVFPNAA